MAYTNYQKGSEWRKWDLHVHTKETNKNDQFISENMDVFFVHFFKKALDNNIKGIGITDYFSVENYKKAIQFVSDIESKVDEQGNAFFSNEEKIAIQSIFIFPNVELRMLPSTGTGKLINIHCLFNPTYINSLDNDFFSSIENQEHFKMNYQGILDYGKSLDSNLDGKNAYIKGVDNFVISVNDLKNIVETKKGFKENSIIVVSNSNNDGNSGLQKHYELFENEPGSLDGVRKSIYYLSNAIFSSNPKDKLYFLGQKKNDQDILVDTESVIIEKHGSLKPCINGSDAHTEDKLFKPFESRYCWIKSDLTFEGLKQIIHEPELRVVIQENLPEDKPGYQVIDRIEINNTIIHNTSLELNSNLNSIIGGRSTGKSVLLAAIAKKLKTDKPIIFERNPNYDSFVSQISDSLKVFWKDGVEENSREIEYFQQGYMYELAGQEEKLSTLIQDILKQKGKENILHIYSKNTAEIKKKITDLINDFFQIIADIKEKEQKSSDKGDRKGIEDEIKRLTDDLNKLSASSISETDIFSKSSPSYSKS